MGIVRTTVSIPEDLFDEIKREARKQGTSISKFIAKSLEELILNQKKRKVAMQVLEIVKEEPLSESAGKTAIRELEKLKGEWD